jgi:Raf kinase inhibitor-like YbhB/YbcL family protein
MKLWTDAVDDNSWLDSRYTCDIDNSSPELRWSDYPPATAGFAIVAEEIFDKAPPFAFWLIYNIPPNISHLPAGIPIQDSLPHGILQGINDHGKLGYTGPCPHDLSIHRYTFHLHALATLPELPSRLHRNELLEKILPLSIATTEINVFYRQIAQKAG